MKLKTLLILTAGILLGAFGKILCELVMRGKGQPRGSIINVVNHSRTSLDEVIVEVGPDGHELGSIAPGGLAAARFFPRDSRMAVLNFKTQGRHRWVACGVIGAHDTLAVSVIEGGGSVFITHDRSSSPSEPVPTAANRQSAVTP